MIAQVLRLTRWEWFKLRKRWMPWILLGIAVALCQVFLWGMFYSYNDRLALTVAVSSLIAASLLVDDGGLTDSGEWSTAAVMFGKAVYGLMPYAILALFLSVLTSSSSMGIAMSLAYYFAELILGRILGDLFAWFDNVSDFLIGFNTAAWMSESGMVTTEGTLFPVSDPPGVLHAFLVVAAYIIVLGAAAFWLFQRRDVAGARGE